MSLTSLIEASSLSSALSSLSYFYHHHSILNQCLKLMLAIGGSVLEKLLRGGYCAGLLSRRNCTWVYGPEQLFRDILF